MTVLSYEGARRGRREQGWVTSSTSANAEIGGDRIVLRDRVRSLLRDNPYAVKGAAALVTNRIGTGILATADGPNARVNARVNARWERWVDHCDLTGRTDYYGIQALAEKTRIESGEALIRLVRLPGVEDDEDVPLRLQVLEPDYLDTTKNDRLENGNEIREGIEYSGNEVVAYWLFDQHPGDNSPVLRFTTRSQRVSARDVIHYYRVLRPGQLSGVSEFAPVIRRLYDLDGYADAELMRKKIAACSVGFVTSPAQLPGASLGPTALDSDGRRVESFAPGMYHYGKPGESVSFFDPKPSGDYGEFFSVELHAIAAGLGIPYELLTGDLSEVTYTSHRGGLVQFRAMVEADQWQLVIPQVCRQIWDRFVRDSEMVPGLSLPAKYTPPRFGLLDPAKEIPAQIEALNSGIDSYPNLIRREGYEWREKLDEIAEFQDELKKRGIVLPSLMPKTPPSQEAPPAAKPDPDGGDKEQQAA